MFFSFSVLMGISGSEVFAESNDIISFRVVSESTNQIVMEVSYVYAGNFGSNVYIGAKMASNGNPSRYFAYQPGRISRGRHKTRVSLSTATTAPSHLTTNQILLYMYIGSSYSFLEEFFPYHKTWSKLRLPAPRQVSPANGTTFSHYPRRTTLAWNPVPGATSYTVEIDCYQCCQKNKWCSDVGRMWKVQPNLNATSYTFDFVGAQPGRWRVWAVGPGGQQSPKSGWWNFYYRR